MNQGKTIIHTEKEIIGIRKAAQAAAFVKEQLKILVQPGMTTKEIDDLAGRLIESTGGISAFLGFHGFPGNICISLNDEVVHGIGIDNRYVMNGDLVSLDVGVSLDGYIGDNAETSIIGPPVDESAIHLIDKTRLSLHAGIKAAIKGNFVRDISCAIQNVASKANLGIVREYVGHGCGTQLHEPPEIPNYKTSEKGPKLKNGMVLAIEPMLNLGTHKVKTDKDGWTVRTFDAKLSAHFEHMILINDNKPEILTWPKK
jgi:methionyl aminopeptidase